MDKFQKAWYQRPKQVLAYEVNEDGTYTRVLVYESDPRFGTGELVLEIPVEGGE